MLYEKIIKIMEELIPIGKIKREEISTVMQPLLAKYKLVIKPSEVIEYKYINQEASFKIKYEIIDAENNELKSILIEVPGGGFDQEGKGRATYMASTGAYRQALQQLFVIQIEDELSQINNNIGSNIQEDFTSYHEFQDTEQNETISSENTQNIENINNEQIIQSVNIEELTNNDIDREFANF